MSIYLWEIKGRDSYHNNIEGPILQFLYRISPEGSREESDEVGHEWFTGTLRGILKADGHLFLNVRLVMMVLRCS